MNKGVAYLVIAGLIIFIIIIFAVSLSLKKYGEEPVSISPVPSAKIQGSTSGVAAENKKTLQQEQEELESEPPLKPGEPLLN